MTPFVVASSPLLGCAAMSRLAEALRATGHVVSTPVVPFALDEFTDAVAVAVRDADERPVVVGYSAAGPRLFHVASNVDLAGIVFLDARLPADGVAPDEEQRFAELLDALPRGADGTLPPWPSWWPASLIAELVPDPAVRDELVAGCERPPRAMFSRPIPAPPPSVPCGFVAFGEGYAADLAEARRRDWPVVEIADAHHLWPVTHPEAVAAALVDVAERLTA